jgi:2-polyprenyl-3-methyl-5-hydroxy-6-metoxy-1,4-benzoquinol methylase
MGEVLHACPFCGGQLVIHWQSASFWRCRACWLLWRNPLPTEKELRALYERSWASPHLHTSETGGTTLEKAYQYSRNLLRSVGWRDFRQRTILDFGAGFGIFASTMASLGAEVWAVEPYGYEACRSRGLNVVRDLAELPAALVFDGAVCLDTVEHLRRPWETLRYIAERLAPWGWLFVSTPNADGLNARLYRDRWREALKAGHVVLFNTHSLCRVLDAAGFTRYRRLRWFVRYSSHPVRRVLHAVLQTIYLDGEIRILAWKG